MARTHLSILTQEKWLENKVIFTIKSTNYTVGYSGSNEHEFITYLKNNSDSNHILFVKPTRAYQSAYIETDLRSFTKIDIIIIAPPLADEHIGLIQASGISGYIVESDITSVVFLDIVNQLYRHNYYANNQIPKVYWENHPKILQILPQPKFTPREKEVLYLMCHNYTNASIADYLGTKTSNVRGIVTRLKRKTFTKTSLALVALSVVNKWVILDSEIFRSSSPFLRNLGNK